MCLCLNSTFGYKIPSPTFPQIYLLIPSSNLFFKLKPFWFRRLQLPYLCVYVTWHKSPNICLNINAAVRIYYFRILFSHYSGPIPIGFMIPFGPTPRVAIQTLSCIKYPFVLQILSILWLLLKYPMGLLYTWKRVTVGKSSVMFLPPSKLVVAVSMFKNMVARGFSLHKFGSVMCVPLTLLG